MPILAVFFTDRAARFRREQLRRKRGEQMKASRVRNAALPLRALLMRSTNPELMTDEQRTDEIRRLERIRDKLLDAAPKHFYFRRILLPLMLALVLISTVNGLMAHHAQLTLSHGLVLVAFLILLGHATWKVWRSTPTDKWSISDSLGYEGDSPREIQQKIDSLRRLGR